MRLVLCCATSVSLFVTGFSGLVAAQDRPGVRVGGHVSINPSGFEAREPRVGIHLIAPLLQIFEISPALGYYVTDRFPGSAWQLTGTVRIRPFAPGTSSPFYVGAGVTRLDHARGSVTDDVLVAGVDARLVGIQTFAEVLHYGLFKNRVTGGGALNVMMGMNLSL